MHGYFLSLRLYDAARVIANPYVYEEHRAKMVQEKLDKLAEGRIRTRKDQVKVKVNKALAEKIAREEEREQKREERKPKKTAEDNTAAMEVDEEEEPASKHKHSLLSDSRFAALFEDPDFQVDEQSREYALLNPSAATQKRNRAPEVEGGGWGQGKTAVEEEDEESDKMSSDDQEESASESSSPSGEDESEEDSSEAGGTHTLFSIVVTDPTSIIQILFYLGNRPTRHPPHDAQRIPVCALFLSKRRLSLPHPTVRLAETLPSDIVDPQQRDIDIKRQRTIQTGSTSSARVMGPQVSPGCPLRDPSRRRGRRKMGTWAGAGNRAKPPRAWRGLGRVWRKEVWTVTHES